MPERRGNNEGSIYQVAGGGWEAAVTIARGKRRRLRRDTYDEARIARDQLLAERDRQIDLDRRLTVGQLLDEFLEDLKVDGHRPRTWEGYESVVRLYIKPELGSTRAGLLTPGEFRRFQSSLLRGSKERPSLAPAYVAKIRSVLHSAYRWALAEERLPRNPVAAIAPPKIEEYEAAPLTVAEAIAALKAIRDHEHGPFWAFLIATGCRFGEAAGLRVPEIDLETATVSIIQAAARLPKEWRQEAGQGWEIARTKTRKSRRTIPLTRFAVAALVRQAEIVADMRASAGARWQEHGLVFPNSRGGVLRNDHVGKRWHEAMKNADLPTNVRLHDLRHTLGTLQRQSGTDLKTIQELLGHSSVQITGDIYVGAAPDALRQAVERYELMLTAPDSQSGEATATTTATNDLEEAS